MSSNAQIIQAPSRPARIHRRSIFLAGTTTATGEADWREQISYTLADQPVTIFNPKRDDWDSSWREDSSDARWVEQIQWELDMQSQADIIVVLFHGITAAPISLAEMGMASQTGKLIACALDGYSKQGYVEAVCKKFDASFITTEEQLKREVVARLGMLL